MSTDCTDRLHRVEAAGSPHEIGLQLGRFGAAAVHGHLVATRAWGAITAHRRDARVLRMAAQVRSRFPAIMAEIEGLAEGLELPVDPVFAWNCRGDIAAMAPDGCTTVQVPGSRIVVAHNEDGDPGFRGACGLLRARPRQGIGFTAFVYPGSIPGHTFAATEAGLVQTVNNIRSHRMGDGLPRMVLTRAGIRGIRPAPSRRCARWRSTSDGMRPPSRSGPRRTGCWRGSSACPSRRRCARSPSLPPCSTSTPRP